MKRIDVNSDLGEGFGVYTIGNDEQVLDIVTSANIACGYHAGDYNIMAKTVKMAKAKNVGIGAHPGLPDLFGFGRRAMQVTPEDIFHLIVYQIGALQAFCRIHDVALRHVKPHGALYQMAVKDDEVAAAVAQAVYKVNPDLILFGLSGSHLIHIGNECGLRTASEVFADRTYQHDGTLTPRTEDNALITDVAQAEAQVVSMVKKAEVPVVGGGTVPITVDTICVHGDGTAALAFVKRLRQRLEQEGVAVKKVGE